MSGSKTQLAGVAHELAGRSYVVVAIEYRLAPRDIFPAQIEDCREALAWMLRQASHYAIDSARVAVWGYSAGGHLAALLAVECGAERQAGPASRKCCPIKAVIAGGAPCDFRGVPPESRQLAFWLGGSRAEKPESYRAASPAAAVGAGTPPIFFYHGQNDRLVQLDEPRRMMERLRAAGVETDWFVIPGAGHIAAFLDREAVKASIEFLDKHLRPGKTKLGTFRGLNRPQIAASRHPGQSGGYN